MKILIRLSFFVATLSLMITLAFSKPASATTYYVAANGSDSNNGTSKTTPWLHAPGMPNCKSACAGANPGPGDSIIFRGGDTWHFGNTGLATSVGGTWQWIWDGASGNPIYIGVDQTWYTGSSWVRPIMSGDNPLSTSFVSSCAYDNYAALSNSGAFFITYTNSQPNMYFTLDNLEWSGRCWGASSGSNGGVISINQSPNYVTISNNYFHGWTTVKTSSDGYVNVSGSGQGGRANNNVLVGNVFDGSDSSQDLTGANCQWYPGNSCASSGATYGTVANDMHNNIFRYMSNFNVSTDIETFHDNLAEYLYTSYQNNGPHSNVLNTDDAVAGTNFYFYNNVLRHNYVTQLMFLTVPEGQTGYIFNNVVYDSLYYDGGTFATNCFLMESTFDGSATLYFYNNTLDWGTGGCLVTGSSDNIAPNSTRWNGTMYFQNNHFIGYDANHNPPSVANGVTHCTSPAACTFTDNGNEIFQTEAAANGQGYTSSSSYAPTSASGATVGAGANLASLCPAFSSDNAFCSGTSAGAMVVQGSGGELAGYPAVALVARPDGAWNSGAYQFAGSQAPSAPTGLAVVVQQ
jgi:hypothetical protein